MVALLFLLLLNLDLTAFRCFHWTAFCFHCSKFFWSKTITNSKIFSSKTDFFLMNFVLINGRDASNIFKNSAWQKLQKFMCLDLFLKVTFWFQWKSNFWKSDPPPSPLVCMKSIFYWETIFWKNTCLGRTLTGKGRGGGGGGVDCGLIPKPFTGCRTARYYWLTILAKTRLAC